MNAGQSYGERNEQQADMSMEPYVVDRSPPTWNEPAVSSWRMGVRSLLAACLLGKQQRPLDHPASIRDGVRVRGLHRRTKLN